MVINDPLPDTSGNEAEVLSNRFRRAKGIKDLWLPKFEECYEYSMPQRESLYAQTQGQVRTDKIFDETAVVGVQEFASRLQAGLVPNYARWAELIAGSEIPDEQKSEVDVALETVTNYIFEIIQNSNFAQETHEAFLDLAVGTACLQVMEGDAINPVLFTAIPLSQLYLDIGPDDKIDHIFRERSLRASNIKVAYPKATIPDDLQRKLDTGKDEHITLVDCTYRIYGSLDEEHQRVVFDPKTKDIYFKEKFKGVGSGQYVKSMVVGH